MILEGKTIIVTGGNKGIGLEISKKIIKEGGYVFICSKNDNDNLKEYYGHYSFFKCDVSDEFQVHRFMNTINEKYNNVYGLVNCAGIYGPIGKTTIIDNHSILNTIKINLMGTINMCNSFINLIKNKKRKIVNFSGGGASGPFPNYSAYAISKIGIVKLTENLSIELSKDNIDINCIAPGFVATNIHKKTLEAGPHTAGKEFYEKTKEQLEGKSTSPKIAADLVIFLLSEESNGISGKFISAPWDPWKEKNFQEELRNNKDLATIRRIDNKYFRKI